MIFSLSLSLSLLNLTPNSHKSFMTNSSKYQIKICSPSSFDPHACTKKKTTRWNSMTHTTSRYHLSHSGCVQMQSIALFSYSNPSASSVFSHLFRVTHMHTFVLTNVGQIECLYQIRYPLDDGSRSSEQLCIGPDILTYISSFVSVLGKERKVDKATHWSPGCHNSLVFTL